MLNFSPIFQENYKAASYGFLEKFYQLVTNKEKNVDFEIQGQFYKLVFHMYFH